MSNPFLKLSIVVCLLICSNITHAAPHQFPEADMTQLGDVPTIKTPLYIMEYHIWHKSPFGIEAPDGYVHWDMGNSRIDHAIGPDWMRDKGPVGYPMLGLYNSEDRNVIRWQLQCMQNTGVDGTFVQMFPEWTQGKYFDRTFVWDVIMDEADKLGYKIGMHDEVQFRIGQPARLFDERPSRRSPAPLVRARVHAHKYSAARSARARAALTHTRSPHARGAAFKAPPADGAKSTAARI